MKKDTKRPASCKATRVKKGSGWYWTTECQKKEKAADKDIKAGRVKRCYSAKELKKELCE